MIVVSLWCDPGTIFRTGIFFSELWAVEMKPPDRFKSL